MYNGKIQNSIMPNTNPLFISLICIHAALGINTHLEMFVLKQLLLEGLNGTLW